MNAATILALIQGLLPLLAQLLEALHTHATTRDDTKALVGAMRSQVSELYALTERAADVQGA